MDVHWIHIFVTSRKLPSQYGIDELSHFILMPSYSQVVSDGPTRMCPAEQVTEQRLPQSLSQGIDPLNSPKVGGDRGVQRRTREEITKDIQLLMTTIKSLFSIDCVIFL